MHPRWIIALLLCSACPSSGTQGGRSTASPTPSHPAATPTVATSVPAVASEPPPRLWVAQLGGPSIDSLSDAALSPSGDLVLVGEFDEELVVSAFDGSHTKLREGEPGLLSGAYLVLQDPHGRTRFARTLGDTGTLVARAATFASDGAVVVVGWFDGEAELAGRTLVARAPEQPLASRGDEDGFVARFTSDGALQHVSTFGGAGGVDVVDVAATVDGDVIVAGDYRTSLELGGRTLLEPAGEWGDAFVARLDAGGQARWLVRLGGPQQDSSRALAATADGGAIVVGDCQGQRFSAGERRLDCGPGGGFVVRLSATGTVMWAHALQHRPRPKRKGQPPGFAVATTGVMAREDGGAIVTATFGSRVRVSDERTLDTRGWNDALILALDARGTPGWVRQLGAEGSDVVTAPISDGRDGLWVTGTIAGPPVPALGAVKGVGLAADVPPLDPEPLRWPDAAVFVHLDAAGTPDRLVRLGGEPGRLGGPVEGRHVFLDGDGRLRLVAMFLGELRLPQIPGTLQSRGVGRVANQDDVVVAAIDPTALP